MHPDYGNFGTTVLVTDATVHVLGGHLRHYHVHGHHVRIAGSAIGSSELLSGGERRSLRPTGTVYNTDSSGCVWVFVPGKVLLEVPLLFG